MALHLTILALMMTLELAVALARMLIFAVSDVIGHRAMLSGGKVLFGEVHYRGRGLIVQNSFVFNKMHFILKLHVGW